MVSVVYCRCPWLLLLWKITEVQLNHQYIYGLVQERHNSSALAMELCFSCTNPSICECSFVKFICKDISFHIFKSAQSRHKLATSDTMIKQLSLLSLDKLMAFSLYDARTWLKPSMTHYHFDSKELQWILNENTNSFCHEKCSSLECVEWPCHCWPLPLFPCRPHCGKYHCQRTITIICWNPSETETMQNLIDS